MCNCRSVQCTFVYVSPRVPVCLSVWLSATVLSSFSHLVLLHVGVYPCIFGARDLGMHTHEPQQEPPQTPDSSYMAGRMLTPPGNLLRPLTSSCTRVLGGYTVLQYQDSTTIIAVSAFGGMAEGLEFRV